MNNTAYQESDLRFAKRLTNNNRTILLLILAFLIFSLFYSEWKERDILKVEFVSIDNVKLIGKSELCPGEYLLFSYDVHISGSGILERDFSVWKIDPPKTVIYSEYRRSILDEEIDQSFFESYRIPFIYHNYETGIKEMLPPGRYERRISLSTPSDRTVVAIRRIPFTVKEGCEE